MHRDRSVSSFSLRSLSRPAWRTAMIGAVAAGTVIGLGASLGTTGPASITAKTAAAGASLASASPIAAVETFKVDPGHSMALFRVMHLGAGAFWGRFDAVSGTITTDSATATGLSFDISIDVNSVNTASTQRDNHLKSPDFFSAKEFPAMTFKSTSAKKLDGNNYEVAGDLAIRGITKPITAKVLWTGTAELGMGRRAGFEATFTIDRGEFGVSYGLDNNALGRQVQVIVALEGLIPKQ